ncbi:MAG: nucleoside-diphosphate sugar epimerase/dehydratase, partial [Pseudomonadota bacterium]
MTTQNGNSLIHPRVAIVVHDLFMVWAAWTLVHALRYSFWPGSPELTWFPREMPIVLVVQALVLHVSGLYRGIWRFASLPDLWNIVRAATVGTVGIGLAMFLLYRLEGVPRSVFVMYPVLLTFLLGGPRLAYRVWKDHRLEFHARPGRSVRVLILGAGRTGDLLARDLRAEGIYYPIGFLDDDRQLRGRKLRGLPVFGTIGELDNWVSEKSVGMVVIAIPSATRAEMRRIVELCEGADVDFRTVPRMQDLVSGHFGSAQLQTVAIEDLLGREPVDLDWEAIRSGCSGRAVLVTGGGGSIGAELCRQIAQLSPARLGIVDQSEFNLYEIEREVRHVFPDLLIEATLADVCDTRAMDRVVGRFRPDIVFHAAAYKQVPLLQAQLREAVRNNLVGTMTMARCAQNHGVSRFVLISTDKAVNPANVMGATKRSAEIFCQLLAEGHTATRFLTVRFGNVLDSAGSVVPLFREQIAAGGPVTVTHPEVTRFFMTIPEACQLILETAAIGDGGQIYVLDMGQPVRIRYLAEQMIRLSGQTPDEDIPIVYTG